MNKEYTTNSAIETQDLGKKFAGEILQKQQKEPIRGAVVLALKGELGSGKTTFLQGFAKGLGIEEKILSPTYVILKKFEISKQSNFYHIDCYRIENEKDILELGFNEIISNPKNIIAIEWPERIKNVLPRNTLWLDFEFIDNNKREIRLDNEI
ncbi:MAG: tRNA (adenosine(37)-N6)-threonylcarbamoyltransferase complex ATPase subunit type 1 TsaE [Parcubacteria group bacterium]|nr:tRNA (adenosine(37)-N6)-threonylcarbamoyltransferase complex ATPase subunit type 1 TsaE [Parcubacteria group bacterium]